MSCCPPAGLYNITCNQGATFSRTITWKDSRKQVIVLTNYTARMQVRSEVTASTVLISLTTENGRISIDAPLGQVHLTITATDTSALPAGKYVYDLELVSPTGVVNRIVEGNFLVKAEVTR